MNYSLMAHDISANHLATIIFTAYGEPYIVGVTIEEGINGVIRVHYLGAASASGAPEKRIHILVVIPWAAMDEFTVENYVPIGIVKKKGGETYAVFAKFS